MSWVAVGLAVGGGLLSAYHSGRKTDAQAKQLESQRQELLIRERETRAQAVRQKSLAYQSAYQSQVFGDLEQSIITRLQHFNTQKHKMITLDNNVIIFNMLFPVFISVNIVPPSTFNQMPFYVRSVPSIIIFIYVEH